MSGITTLMFFMFGISAESIKKPIEDIGDVQGVSIEATLKPTAIPSPTATPTPPTPKPTTTPIPQTAIPTQKPVQVQPAHTAVAVLKLAHK